MVSSCYNTCHVLRAAAAAAAGAPKVNVLNYTQPNGFLPFGFGGVVKAASSVFFA
jgi:hypothetical protein